MININTVHCADALALCRELPEASVDLIATDPPYGVTSCPWDVKVPLDAMWDAFKRIIKPRGAIVITASQPFTSELVMSNRKMFKYEWVWRKNRGSNFCNAQVQPMKEHEGVLVFGYTSTQYYPQPTRRSASGASRVKYPINPSNHDKRQTIGRFFDSHIIRNGSDNRVPGSVLDFNTQNNPTHPTQKPVALFEYLIRTYTRPGDLVVDPFCGSGTTAIAARNTGRNYIVGDFLQEYVDICEKRLSAPFTPPLFDLDAPAAPRAETLPLWNEAE